MIECEDFYSGTYRSELSFKNKLSRLVWGVVWCMLFRPSPRPLFGWRRLLLKLFGAKLASTAAVYPSAKIWAPWNLQMGERSVLGDCVDCYSVDEIVLEDDVTVSQYAFLCSASHNIESPSRDLVHQPIRLERGCWVFAGAFIGMGIVVGEGAVVAARSVVVKDVESFSVVGGNPSKLIKRRKADWVARGK
tara:strand:- start:313 stop:885 length:573 start_codon:yes stop_codon:yes gene_type:complete